MRSSTTLLISSNPVGAFRLYLVFYFALKVAFIFSGTDLYTEEAQYWMWSRYPDWSYYSKPPLIAWINYVTDIFPPSDVVIRFNALLFGAGTLFVYYKLSFLVFNSERIARLSVIILSVSPYFVLASTFFTTDSLLIFFWVLTFYLLLRALRDPSVINWLLTGLALGFGCLSKYAMLFLLFVVIPLWRPNQKNIMKGLGITISVALLVFMPVIIWNFQHDWVTVKHVGALAISGNTVTFQNSIEYILEFAGGVILIVSPFLLLMFLDRKFRRAVFHETSESVKGSFMLLVFPMIATLLVFFIVSIFKRTEVNWPSVTYSALPMIFAYGAEKSRMHVKALSYSAITIVAMSFILFPASFDMMGMPGLMPAGRDTMKRMAGWSDLANDINKLRQTDKKDTWLLTDSYQVASEVSFYTRQQNVLCLNLGRRMNQFDIWLMSRTDIPRSFEALYITESPTIDPSVTFGHLGNHVIIPIHYRGQVVTKFHVYMLSGVRLTPSPKFTSY